MDRWSLPNGVEMRHVRVVPGAGGGRRVPLRAWLGLALIGLGGAFALHLIDRRLDTDGMGAIAIGLVALAAWVVNRWQLAMWPGVVFAGYGIARVCVGLAILTGSGWTTLGIAAGLMVGWAIARTQGSRATWPLLLAAIAAVVGAVQVAQQIVVIRQLEDVAAAALIIAVGVMLVRNATRRNSFDRG